MKDALNNTALFIIAIIVIVGATWYASPNGSIDKEEEIKIISEREIIDFMVEEDIFGSVVKYSYKGEKLPDELVEDEVIEMRTESSFTKLTDILNEGTKDEELVLDLVSYTQRAFFNDEGEWYYVEYDTALRSIFDEATKQGFISRIFSNVVYAATNTSYSAVGDGHVYGTSLTSWADARSLGTGIDYTNTVALSQSYYHVTDGGKGDFTSWSITRTFLPFDTSSISADATISAATLNTYIIIVWDTDVDEYDYITVVQTSQASHSSLVTADYDNIVTTEGIATGQRKDLATISTSTYLIFTLNSTGLGWIAKSGASSDCSSTNGISCFGLREGHDNVGPSIATPAAGGTHTNGIQISTSEETGTSQDPYLSVTYTLPSTFAPWMFHEF